MAINAGPYVSWGLYKASNLPLAFVRWWLDVLPIIPPTIVAGLPITAINRLTGKIMATVRMTKMKASRQRR